MTGVEVLDKELSRPEFPLLTGTLILYGLRVFQAGNELAIERIDQNEVIMKIYCLHLGGETAPKGYYYLFPFSLFNVSVSPGQFNTDRPALTLNFALVEFP